VVFERALGALVGVLGGGGVGLGARGGDPLELGL
jgi:hypothetical protein